MTGPLLELAGIETGYGDLTVLRDITLSVGAGEIVCIAGRNGVGKSTLMKLVGGFLPARRGTIIGLGRNLAGLQPHLRQRAGLSYAPQDDVVFAPLTVRENLTLHLQSDRMERYGVLFDAFPRMHDRLDQTSGTLSGGERKLLSFTRVMGEGGRLICLDEPTEGVQPENIMRMAKIIRAAAGRGAGLLIVEQNLTLVEAVADRAIVIDHGAIIHEQTSGPDLRAGIVQHLKV